MKHYLLLILLLIPLASALEIQPIQDVELQSTDVTEITANWSSNSTNYTLVLSNTSETITQKTIQTTSHTWNLSEGNYTLHVTDEQNNTATETFNIYTQEESETTDTIEIDLTFNKYEQDTFYFTISSDSVPYSTTIQLITPSGASHEWLVHKTTSPDTLTLQKPINESGTYIARAYHEDTERAQAFFELNHTTPLEAEITHEDVILNENIVFEAQAEGGITPYTYNWSFTGPINSTPSKQEQDTEIRFVEPGNYTAQLTITDSEDQKLTVTKEIHVPKQTYEYSMVVAGSDKKYQEGLTVRMYNNDTDKQTTTDQTGFAAFNGLSQATYQLVISKLQTTYLNTTIQLEANDFEQYTIQLPHTQNDSQQEVQEQEDTREESLQTQTTAKQQPTTTQETLAQQELTQAQQLEEHKQALATNYSQLINEVELSSIQKQALKHLSLYQTLANAPTTIQQAQNMQELRTLQQDIPSDITIQNHQTIQTTFRDEQIQKRLEDYLHTQNITNQKTKQQYLYSITKLLENSSIETTTYTITITYPNKKQTHQVVSRDILAGSQAQAIEIIPYEFASSPSRIHTQQEYEILRENPILSFTDTQYTYSAQTSSQAQPELLLMPTQLTQVPLFTGLATSTAAQAITDNVSYVLILALFVAGLIAGKKIHENNEQQLLFDEFYDLAITATNLHMQNNHQQASKVIPHVLQLHKELPASQQEQLTDVISQLTSTHKTHVFKQELASAYETIKSNATDINTISNAYEQALHAYEELPITQQKQHKEEITRLEEALTKI